MPQGWGEAVGVVVRGEARNVSVLGFLAKVDTVPCCPHWALCHVWKECRKPRMYSWIGIHTNNTTWKCTTGGQVAGYVFLWKRRLEKWEKPLRIWGAIKQKWFCWAQLGLVEDMAVIAPNHSQVTGPFGNLNERYGPLRKADTISGGLRSPDILGTSK